MADDGDYNRSQRPLQGVIMCCTSIPPEKRSNLASIASQMGAVNKLDLTSDVTHLIVGETDTPKYKYVAKERPDVKCLLPEWIEAVRQSWLEGDEIDVKALEEQYKLPTFVGLRVCVTGFDDLAERKHLEETIKQNGGEYRGNLTKDVTHLIAFKPMGSKYSFAKTWGIRIVSLEWLEQSLERGMILDENLYDPLLPVSERGQDAWVRRTVSTTSLNKRPRENEAIQPQARKLRRTASARFSSQSDGIWTNIVRDGLGSESAPHSESGIVHADRDHDDESTPKGPGHLIVGNEVELLQDRKPSLETDLSQNASLNATPLSNREDLFYGKRFYLHGFDTKQTSILQRHLCSHGADVVESLGGLSQASTSTETDQGFLLVPHSSSDRNIPCTTDMVPSPTLVTDLWVERCLHRKECVHPQESVINTPFKFPIKGFESIVITSTAFEGVDLLHLGKAVKLLGATYDQFLTPNTAALLCNDYFPTREKIRHAFEWDIPVVKPEWLWDCIRYGRQLPFDSYLFDPAKNGQGNGTMAKKTEEIGGEEGTGLPSTDTPLQRKSSQKTKRLFQSIQKEQLDGGSIDSAQSSVTLQAQNIDTESMNGIPFTYEHRSTPISQGHTHNKEHEVASTHTVQNPPTPLNELSPNSPPRKPSLTSQKISFEPVKEASPTDLEGRESLDTAISSLLAHHQRETRNDSPTILSFETSKFGRRKHRLLGRAPSNLSARSLSFSRASSVDTMNTDGLGTPIESVNSATSLKFPEVKDANPATVECRNSITASALAAFGSQAKCQSEDGKEILQMTQLGYEDPEALVWREKLMRKMGAGKESEGFQGLGVAKVKGFGTVKDSVGLGGAPQSISRRTRRAGGR